MSNIVLTASSTHTGLIRPQNEDHNLIIQQADQYPLALIIADGMGGHRHGEVASLLAVEYVAKQMRLLFDTKEKLTSEAVGNLLGDILEKANIKVYLNSLIDADREGMGTTLTVAVLIPGTVILAHVGDCRAYLLRDSVMVRLTEDHTLVQELINTGSISPDESEHHPRRNVLTRALGVQDLVKPDINISDLMTGDRLLLCSDGLHGMMSDGQIKEILSRSETPRELADTFIKQALDLGGEDNITVLLAFV